MPKVNPKTGFWNWDRPDEPGLEANPLVDPTTLIGGGTGGLISKLASRVPGKVIQHGAILSKAKVPPLSMDAKIESLRRAGRSIQATFQEKPMSFYWQKVQDALKRMGTE